MQELQPILEQIHPLDGNAMQAARRHWDRIAKPLNSLGLLEQSVIQMAGILGTKHVCLNRRHVVVLCADNGVVEEGVTQIGSEITALVAENLTKGKASVNVMAQMANATVLPVDIGIREEKRVPGLLQRRVACGTKNLAKGPAMTRQQTLAAIQVGLDLVRDLKGQGCDIIATGEMGIGNTTTSSAMASVLLQKPVEEVTGKGAGLSSAGLEKKIQVIRTALAVNQPDPNDPLDVLSKVGGLDLAGMVGIFLGGGVSRIPILMDGFISCVAALTAVRLCPACRDYLLPSHVSKEPAARRILDALACKPLITCEMCLGEGTGAVAALPLLDMALAVYHSMSTFSDIQMENYQPLE